MVAVDRWRAPVARALPHVPASDGCFCFCPESRCKVLHYTPGGVCVRARVCVPVDASVCVCNIFLGYDAQTRLSIVLYLYIRKMCVHVYMCMCVYAYTPRRTDSCRLCLTTCARTQQQYNNSNNNNIASSSSSSSGLTPFPRPTRARHTLLRSTWASLYHC